MSFINAFTSFFSDLSRMNKSNLTGALDIVAVKHDDGTVHCSPFHVRFGKFKLLRAEDRQVRVYVNGKKTKLLMELSPDGSAYFNHSIESRARSESADVDATGSDKDAVPAEVTSPATGRSADGRRGPQGHSKSSLSASSTSVSSQDVDDVLRKDIQRLQLTDLPQLLPDNSVEIDGMVFSSLQGWNEYAKARTDLTDADKHALTELMAAMFTTTYQPSETALESTPAPDDAYGDSEVLDIKVDDASLQGIVTDAHGGMEPFSLDGDSSEHGTPGACERSPKEGGELPVAALDTSNAPASRSMNEELKPSEGDVSAVFSSQKTAPPSVTSSILTKDREEGLPGMRKGQLHEMMDRPVHDDGPSKAPSAITSANASALGAVPANEEDLAKDGPFSVQHKMDTITGEETTVLSVDPIAAATATLDVPPVTASSEVSTGETASTSTSDSQTHGTPKTNVTSSEEVSNIAHRTPVLTATDSTSASQLSGISGDQDNAPSGPLSSLPSSSPTELMKTDPSSQNVSRKHAQGRLTGVWSFFSGARSYVPDESDESDFSDDEWRDEILSQSSLLSVASDLYTKAKSLDSPFISDASEDEDESSTATGGIANPGTARRRSTFQSSLSPPFSSAHISPSFERPSAESGFVGEGVSHPPKDSDPNNADAAESSRKNDFFNTSPVPSVSLSGKVRRFKHRRDSALAEFYSPAYEPLALTGPEPETLDLSVGGTTAGMTASSTISNSQDVVSKIALPSRLLPARSVRLSVPNEIPTSGLSTGSPTLLNTPKHQHADSNGRYRHISPLPPRQPSSRNSALSPQFATAQMSPPRHTARASISIANTPVLNSNSPIVATSQQATTSNLSDVTFAAPWHASKQYPAPSTHVSAVRAGLSGISANLVVDQSSSESGSDAQTVSSSVLENQETSRDPWYSRLLSRYSIASATNTPVHGPSSPEASPPLLPPTPEITLPPHTAEVPPAEEDVSMTLPEPTDTSSYTSVTDTPPTSPATVVEDKSVKTNTRPRGLRGSIVRQNWRRVTYVPQSHSSIATSEDNMSPSIGSMSVVNGDIGANTTLSTPTAPSSAVSSPNLAASEADAKVSVPGTHVQKDSSSASCDTVISIHDDRTPVAGTSANVTTPTGTTTSHVAVSIDQSYKPDFQEPSYTEDFPPSGAAMPRGEGLCMADLRDTSTPAVVVPTPALTTTDTDTLVPDSLAVPNPSPIQPVESQSKADISTSTSTCTSTPNSASTPFIPSSTPTTDPTQTPVMSPDSVIVHFDASHSSATTSLSSLGDQGIDEKLTTQTMSSFDTIPQESRVHLDANGELVFPSSFDEYRKLPLKEALDASFTTYLQSIFLPYPPVVPTSKSDQSSTVTKTAAQVAYSRNYKRNRTAIGSGYSFLPRFGIKIHEVRHFDMCPVVAMSPVVPPYTPHLEPPSTVRTSADDSEVQQQASGTTTDTKVNPVRRPRRRGVSFDMDALTPSQRALCHTTFSFWTFQQESHTSTVSVNDLLGPLKHRIPLIAHTPRISGPLADTSHIPKLSLDGTGGNTLTGPSAAAPSEEGDNLSRSMVEDKELSSSGISRRERYLGWVPILGRIVSTPSGSTAKPGKHGESSNTSASSSRRDSLTSLLSQRTRNSSVSSISSIDSDSSRTSNPSVSTDKSASSAKRPGLSKDSDVYSLRPLPSQLSSIDFQDGVNVITFQVVDRRKRKEKRKIDKPQDRGGSKSSTTEGSSTSGLPSSDTATPDVKTPPTETDIVSKETDAHTTVSTVSLDPLTDPDTLNTDSPVSDSLSKTNGGLEEDPDTCGGDSETVIMIDEEDGSNSGDTEDVDSDSDEEDVIIPNASITCHLFLWSPHAKIIISDVDGTITKSDVLGHLYAVIGKDWTHTGIAELYSNINKNGYHLLYLTARALGQIDTTRSYLQNVKQSNASVDTAKSTPRLTPLSTPFLSSQSPTSSLGGKSVRKDADPSPTSDTLASAASPNQSSSRDGAELSTSSALSLDSDGQNAQTRSFYALEDNDSHALPLGPVITSPDRLFSAFKREVIDRQPQIFKIAALLDIARLFPPGVNPFYAGFGNRETDLVSYRAVGIPDGKIFVVNPEGELRPAVNASYVTSYSDINTLVNNLFPSVNNKLGILSAKAGSIYGKPLAIDDRFTDAYWWKRTLPSLSADDILEAERATEVASNAFGSDLYKKMTKGKLLEKAIEKKDKKGSDKKSK